MTNPTQVVQQWYSNFLNWDSATHDYDTHIGITPVAPLLKDKDVLNLGCFYPNIELALAAKAKSWHAIDFTPEVIDRCRAFTQLIGIVKFEVMDMRYLELPANAFNVVLDLSSGDHLAFDDYMLALDEISRVLQPSGLFITTYANADVIGGEIEKWGPWGYERRICPVNLQAILEQKGFSLMLKDDSSSRAGMVCIKR